MSADGPDEDPLASLNPLGHGTENGEEESTEGRDEIPAHTSLVSVASVPSWTLQDEGSEETSEVFVAVETVGKMPDRIVVGIALLGPAGEAVLDARVRPDIEGVLRRCRMIEMVMSPPQSEEDSPNEGADRNLYSEVKTAPSFSQIISEVRPRLRGKTVWSYRASETLAFLEKTAREAGDRPTAKWAESAREESRWSSLRSHLVEEEEEDSTRALKDVVEKDVVQKRGLSLTQRGGWPALRRARRLRALRMDLLE